MKANIVAPLLPLAIPINDCHPDPTNARTGHAIDRIAASLRQYGQRKPIVINSSEGGKIEAGNGTWEAAKRMGWTHIAAVSLEDSHVDAIGYGLSDNRTGDLSGWDAEMLAILAESLPPEVYTGFEGDELEELLAELGAELDAGMGNGQGDAAGMGDGVYSRKIEAPIYEPKGEKPTISQMFDDSKTRLLIAEIDASDLPENEKAFLRIAAQRHTVINFKMVAEYYAHSAEPMQDLMENSALVIIDFDKAIELGYVKLSEQIAEQYAKDYGTS